MPSSNLQFPVCVSCYLDSDSDLESLPEQTVASDGRYLHVVMSHDLADAPVTFTSSKLMYTTVYFIFK